MLTIPKSVAGAGSGRDRWQYILLAGVVVAMSVIAGWLGGRASSDLEERRLSNQVTSLAQEVTTLHLHLREEENQRKHATAALHSSENAGVAAEAGRLAAQLTRSQAEANQYKSLLDREQSARDRETALVDAFALPGVKTIALKGAEAATGYAVVVPKSKLIFVASHLPTLAAGKRYQLWVTGKQRTEATSAAMFEPKEDGREFLQIEDATLASDVSTVAVTEEPEGGSAEPAGPKILAPETGSAK